MALRTYTTDWMMIYCNNTAGNETVLPAGPYFDCATWKTARCQLEVRGATGNLTVAGALTFANDESTPDASPTVLGSYKAGNGWENPTSTTSITNTAASRQIARPAWSVRNSSGVVFNVAYVRGKFEVEE